MNNNNKINESIKSILSKKLNNVWITNIDLDNKKITLRKWVWTKKVTELRNKYSDSTYDSIENIYDWEVVKDFSEVYDEEFLLDLFSAKERAENLKIKDFVLRLKDNKLYSIDEYNEEIKKYNLWEEQIKEFFSEIYTEEKISEYKKMIAYNKAINENIKDFLKWKNPEEYEEEIAEMQEALLDYPSIFNRDVNISLDIYKSLKIELWTLKDLIY